MEVKAGRHTITQRCLAGLILVSPLAAAFLFFWWQDPKNNLLWYASDIQSIESESFNLTGDCERFITATCSEQNFHAFAAARGFKQQVGNPLPEVLSRTHLGFGGQSIPFGNLANAYYSYEQGGHLHVLAYGNGRLYFYISIW